MTLLLGKIKLLSLLTLLFLFLILPTIIVEARQGCCSHHGGVCGCRCCDGTALSAKCAPYYPNCNGGSVDIEKNTYDGGNTYKATVNYQENEDKWYRSGWVYVIGIVGALFVGSWIKGKVDERKNK